MYTVNIFHKLLLTPPPPNKKNCLSDKVFQARERFENFACVSYCYSAARKINLATDRYNVHKAQTHK